MTVRTLVATAAFAWLAGVAAAQEDSLADVLRRAHTYVAQYEDHVLSGVIAREDYVQRILGSDGGVQEERRLRSDYLSYQLPPDEAWYWFRDVLSVDGEPVPDRLARLREVLSSDASSVDKAMRLAEESARFNLGEVTRTLNTPTFVLSFLRPINRARFRFEVIGTETIGGTRTWMVGYREVRGPTFVRTPEGKEVRVRGRIWIDPSDGRLLRTELLVDQGSRAWRAQVVVDYREFPEVDAWLPAEMRETYDRPRVRDSIAVTGEATYSSYRLADVREWLDEVTR